MKDDKLYLIHISECIKRIFQYTSAGRDEFMRQSIIQDAVIRNLQVMAESSQRLSEESKTHHAEIDWQKISGFRNILVHDYLGVDLDLIWNIIAIDLPELDVVVKRLLEEK